MTPMSPPQTRSRPCPPTQTAVRRRAQDRCAAADDYPPPPPSSSSMLAHVSPPFGLKLTPSSEWSVSVRTEVRVLEGISKPALLRSLSFSADEATAAPS